MLTAQRKQLILTRLGQDGRIVAKLLSDELGTSEDTIRRDLRELARDGLLQRVHGGALPASAALADIAKRADINKEGKQLIGRAAASLIETGQVVVLDGGTTTRELVRALPRDLKATVVTHSPTIAMELLEHPLIEVVLIGGRLFKHSAVTVGAATIDAINRIHADVYFMGVTGIHLEYGLTTGDLEESFIKSAFLSSAAETIVLASQEKLNAVSPFKIASIDQISSFVVERKTSKETLTAFKKAGVTLTLA
jgi:DeoR/GlpR family transcriptional regulator of sugar metabolism